MEFPHQQKLKTLKKSWNHFWRPWNFCCCCKYRSSSCWKVTLINSQQFKNCCFVVIYGSIKKVLLFIFYRNLPKERVKLSKYANMLAFNHTHSQFWAFIINSHDADQNDLETRQKCRWICGDKKMSRFMSEQTHKKSHKCFKFLF